MKKIILAVALVAMLGGCVVTPVPQGRVVVQPSAEVVYRWDSNRYQYYHIDNGRKHYKSRDWHDHKHPHGGPPGQRKKHKDRRD